MQVVMAGGTLFSHGGGSSAKRASRALAIAAALAPLTDEVDARTMLLLARYGEVKKMLKGSPELAKKRFPPLNAPLMHVAAEMGRTE